jgi:hypothetical protein
MKNFILVIVSVFLVSCAANRTTSTAMQNTEQKTETIYITAVKDSVVYRDSIVIRPDGSIDRWHEKKTVKSSVETFWQNIYIKINIDKTITITKTVEVKKEVPVHGFFWWAGILFIAYITIFIIIKIKNKITL